MPGSSPRVISRLRIGVPESSSVGSRRTGRLSVTSGSSPVGRSVSTSVETRCLTVQKTADTVDDARRFAAGNGYFIAVSHIDQNFTPLPGASDSCLSETGAGKNP